VPFETDTPFQVMRAHISQRPPFVRKLHSDAPASLEKIVARCLEKNPSRRYGTPGEIDAELGKHSLAHQRPRSLLSERGRSATPSIRQCGGRHRAHVRVVTFDSRASDCYMGPLIWQQGDVYVIIDRVEVSPDV
jgi:serine/threonine protein kinase